MSSGKQYVLEQPQITMKTPQIIIMKQVTNTSQNHKNSKKISVFTRLLLKPDYTTLSKILLYC
jgi:hypothetical protein